MYLNKIHYYKYGNYYLTFFNKCIIMILKCIIMYNKCHTETYNRDTNLWGVFLKSFRRD